MPMIGAASWRGHGQRDVLLGRHKPRERHRRRSAGRRGSSTASRVGRGVKDAGLEGGRRQGSTDDEGTDDRVSTTPILPLIVATAVSGAGGSRPLRPPEWADRDRGRSHAGTPRPGTLRVSQRMSNWSSAVTSTDSCPVETSRPCRLMELAPSQHGAMYPSRELSLTVHSWRHRGRRARTPHPPS